MDLQDRLRAGPPLILDGGLATELEARGHDLDDPLWSARLLLSEPQAITAVHRDYLRAGADVVITASYQATRAGFRARGLSPADAEAALVRSVALAREAVDAHDRPAWVATSIGPYGAARADGSEYTGDYDLDRAGLLAWHRERLALLDDSGGDLLACETIPSLPEARALAELIAGRTAWVSFSCRDGAHLADGTPIAQAVAAVADAACAVGVNCVAPARVPELLARIRDATDLPLVAYPNSGEVYDAATRSWGGSAADFAGAARGWYDAGARLIGGCCRTTPDHVRQLAATDW